MTRVKQQFSSGGDLAPQGTFSNIGRYFWLSQSGAGRGGGVGRTGAATDI